MSSLYRQMRTLFSMLLTSFLVALWLSPALALEDFPIGYVSTGGTYSFIALMEQERLLEQEGIRPAFVYVGGVQISQALIAGDIRLAIVAAASPVRAAAHGADFRFVGGTIDKEVAVLVSEAKIKTPEALRGTRMAIDRLGDYTDFLARKVLEKFGLQPQKDVLLLQIGSQTARFAAVKSGQVQSTLVVPPLTLIAKRAGLNELAYLGDLGFPGSSASLVILRSTAERYGKEVYGVLRALAKTIRIYKTNKDAGIKAVARFMKLRDREAAEETWRVHAKFYKEIPSPSTEGIKEVMAFLAQTDPDVLKLDTQRLIDTEFTDRLQKEMGK